MLRKISNLVIQIGLIALLIFPPIVFGAVQFQYLSLIQLTIFLICLVWMLKGWAKKSVTFFPTPFDVPLLALVIVGIVNMAASVYTNVTVREWYLWLNYVLVFFLVVQQLRTVRRILGLAFIVLLVGTGESIFGLVQYLQGAQTVLGYQTVNIGTLNATYMNHNHFAGLLIMVIPIAFGLLIGTSNIEKKLFLFLLVGLLLTTLTLTLSRGGLIGFIGAVGFFLTCLMVKAYSDTALKWFAITSVVLLGVIVGGVAVIGISPIAHRSIFRTFIPDAATIQHEFRLLILQSAPGLVKEFPLAGSGLGTFEYVYPRHRSAKLPQRLYIDYAHNDYLELLIEIGIPGLLIVLWGLWRFYRYALYGYFHYRDPVLTGIILGGLTSCTAILIHSFVDFNLQIPANALFFTVILGMTTATTQLLQHGHRRRHGREGISAEAQLTFRFPYTGRYEVKASWKYLLVCLLLLGLLGVNFRKNIAAAYSNRAKSAQIVEGNLLAALTLYQKALAFDPGEVIFHVLLAELYAEIGSKTPYAAKWDRLASAEYQQAIALNPYHADYYTRLGWMYDRLDLPDKAVAAFQQAIYYNPKLALPYRNLGAYYLLLRLPDQALALFRQAIQLDPDSLKPLLALCQEHHISYDIYQQMIPDDPEHRQLFAAALAERQLWNASKAEYRRAIALSDQAQTSYDAMLTACARHRDDACQREIWQELWTKAPENLDWPLHLGQSFEEQQMWAQAAALYVQLLQTAPDHREIRQRLANVYQQQGDTDNALQQYAHLIDLQPQELSAYQQLAALYVQQQNWDAAMQVYQRALAAGLTQAAIYTQLGRIYLNAGASANAIDAYNKAISAGETDFAVYQELEQLYLAQGNAIETDYLWEAYLAANKNQPDAIFQLVQTYRARNEWLKSVTLIKEVIANAPTKIAYRTFLADLYEQKGMLAETRDEYRKILRIQPDHQLAKQKLAQLEGASGS